MRHMPRASASVATIGRPSGMAATASAIAASIIRKASLPVMRPTPAISAARTIVAQTSWPESRASFFSSGELPGSASSTSCETWPSSVDRPVATTTPTPLPRVTEVPLNSIECARRAGRRRRPDRPLCRRRPIRRSASIRRRRDWRPRSAAGRRRSRRRPPSSTMSPGTICSAAMRWAVPSRRTRVERVPSARSASIERAAFNSVRKPISALSASTTAIAAPSSHSPK